MNREYKSDVFSMLMMQPEYALDVYNALNETTYDDPDVEVICTMINMNYTQPTDVGCGF